MRFFVIALCSYTLLLLQSQPLSAGWYEDVKLLSSSATELIFQWKPETRLVTVADSSWLYPSRGAMTDEGNPVRLFHILLPAHQLPTITILDQETVRPVSGDLLLTNRQWLGEPRLLQAGEHSLLELPVYPARLQGSMIEQLAGITVRIRFPAATLLPGLQRGDLDWLKKYTLNPQQAGNWRTRSLLQPLARTADLSGSLLFRFPVNSSGVYRLTPEMLTELVDVDQLQMHYIHVWGNDGRQLPEEIEAAEEQPLHDLLLIYENDDGDELFEAGESILFYASGTQGWLWGGEETGHYTNLYTDENFFWLELDGSVPAPAMEELPTTGGSTVTRADFRYFLEEELNIPRNSPYYSCGDELPVTGQLTFEWESPELSAADEVQLSLSIFHDDGPHAWVQMELNGNLLELFECRSTMVHTEEWDGSYPAGLVEVVLHCSPEDAGTSPRNFLQYLEVVQPAELEFYTDQVFYTTRELSGEHLYSFVPQDEKLILDISDPLQPRYTRGNSLSLTHNDRPAFLLGATEAAWQDVTGLVAFTVQNHCITLPSAEYIVITPEEYREQLTAYVDFRTAGGTSTQLVTLEEILNSCSGGRMDPVAIRNFLYDQYLRHDLQLKNVLLVGNGHYDYRNLSGSSFPVTMPMYYGEIEIFGNPFPWEDYYVRFSDLIEATISRWQCYTSSDVQVQVDKIMRLETDSSNDGWRNRVILVADDERRERGEIRDSEHRHTSNAERLATEFVPPEFEISRIYSAAFPGGFNSSNGLYEKPACEAALVNTLNEGSWLVSFQGHGNNQVWTDERIFTPEHGSLLHNESQLPVFFAATCNWAELDLTHGSAFSVDLMNKPDGGAVGIIAATNLTSGPPNVDFIETFLGCVRDHYEAGSFSTPALCLRETKNLSSSSNRLLYFCQGDPTHSWDYPAHSTVVEGIHDAAGDECDTLLTLGVYHTRANTVARSDSTLQLFSGEAQLQVYDANHDWTLHLQYVDNPDSVVIHDDGNLLFRGRYTIDQGLINGGFIVPRDISQSSEPAAMRFFYYAGDGSYGNGYRSEFYLAASGEPSDDVTGPEAELRFNSEQWHPGEAVGRSFVLLLLAEDENGINLTGEIGHKIELSIDGGQPIDVTHDFSYDLDSWQRGRVEYLVNFLEPGQHNVTARIWDNVNNSTLVSQDFRVIDSGEQRLRDVVNFPNPFSSTTRFTFLVDGLIEDTPLDVTVRVFTLEGRNVYRGEYFALQPESGFIVTPSWDGRNSHGEQLANGVYFYQVAVELPAVSYNIVNQLGQLENVDNSVRRLTAISKLIIGR